MSEAGGILTVADALSEREVLAMNRHSDSGPIPRTLALSLDSVQRQFTNRRQQLASRAQCHAHFLEVIFGDVGKRGQADLVLGKHARILAKAEFFQPLINIASQSNPPYTLTLA